MELLKLWDYWATVVLMMIGMYTMIARESLVKKMMVVFSRLLTLSESSWRCATLHQAKQGRSTLLIMC